MSFAELFIQQLNNPECSMLTGMYMGEFFIVKWLFYLFLIIMIFQMVEKLAWQPFLDWLQKKIFKKVRK